MTGVLFAVVGPSGVGKDTLMRAVQAEMPGITLIRRVITRPSDAGGEEFEGVSEAEFTARLNAGDFALHWQAHGLRYGIPSTLHQDLAQGKLVLFNGSRAMLLQAAKSFPQMHVLHITASDTILEQRLRARRRESQSEIARRLERARLPLPAGLKVTTIDNSTTLDLAKTAMLAAMRTAVPDNPSPSHMCDTRVS